MEMIMHDKSNDNQPPDPKEEESSKRLKRDEWSEGAVDCLLDVYESKWVLRNRAKLKGHDWEEVACRVSSRANTSNSSSKTSTQCKNKIESMKKRYRSESAAGSGSRWPLFSRIDGLVRYRTAPTDLVFFDQNTAARAPLATETQNSQSPEHNALQAQATKVQEDRIKGNGGVQHDEREKEIVNNATSIYDAFNEKKKIERNKGKRKEREEEEEEECDVMESIQWLAEVALRMEQARIKNMREVQKIRAEAEAKKGEMDLKRTKIIANTQLQIAKILARNSGDLDSLLTSDYLFPLGI